MAEYGMSYEEIMSCVIKLEEIEQISSIHRTEMDVQHNRQQNPYLYTKLHRQPSQTSDLRRMERKCSHMSCVACGLWQMVSNRYK